MDVARRSERWDVTTLDHPPQLPNNTANPVAILENYSRKPKKLLIKIKKEQYNEYLEFGSDCMLEVLGGSPVLFIPQPQQLETASLKPTNYIL